MKKKRTKILKKYKKPAGQTGLYWPGPLTLGFIDPRVSGQDRDGLLRLGSARTSPRPILEISFVMGFKVCFNIILLFVLEVKLLLAE